MLASLVMSSSAPMGEVAMLRRMDDDDDDDDVADDWMWMLLLLAAGTNASEDGAHSATATARERNIIVWVENSIGTDRWRRGLIGGNNVGRNSGGGGR